ncbi:MAG: AAA family ATPase [Anaerococcus sp.]|nr:AAA family ATPase [Anaerococcus sp.]
MTRVYIKQIHLISFGKFENKIIRFDPSFNLIYGKNESGKSTISSFIEGLLYGFDKGRSKVNFSYKKQAYRPQMSYKYAGSGIFNKDGIDYEVFRNFDDGSYRIRNLKDNTEVKDRPSNLNFPGLFILGLDYDLYKNYIRNFQSQKLDPNALDKLVERLSSKDIDYNFSANLAIDNLKEKNQSLGSSRAYTKPYAKTKKLLDELTDSLSDISKLKDKYYKDFKNLDQLREDLKRKSDEQKRLQTKVDFYKKTRASSNFRDYKKWSDDLYKINESLKSYKDVAGLDEKYFDDLEKNLDQGKAKENPLVKYSYLFMIITILLGVFVNNLFYFLLIPLIYLWLVREKTDDQGVKLRSINKKRGRFLKYKALISERSKIEDVLSILKKQDLSDDTDFMVEEFDFDTFDIDNQEARLGKLKIEIDDLKDIISQQEKDLVGVEEKISIEVDLIDRKKYLEEKILDIENKKEAIRLAINVIEEIIDENRKDFTSLNRKINKLIEEISKNSYKEIDLDDDMNISIRTKTGYKLNLDQVSKGFFDQLFFALRLSLNDEVFSKIFMTYDDAFINYDIERLRSALLFLLDSSSTRQVIYFTSHKREEEFFLSEAIKINYLDMENI